MRVKRSRTSSPKKKAQTRTIATSAVGLGVAALATAPAAHAATFTVTNLNDAGAGSLREAISDANGAAGADVINFQAGLTGTISLSSGQLSITDSVDIQGPGATSITVSGNNASRVFYLYSGSEIDVRIADLTISDGAAIVGAGIANFGENLELDGVVLSANNSASEGGAIFGNGAAMDTTIRSSTISGNTSGDDGGGIYFYISNSTLIENSVITGNTASADGGGVYFYTNNDTITIRESTISDNNASYGGGLFVYQPSAPVVIERTTISGNDANTGGGIFLYMPFDDVTIENSTISGNQALTGAGGGIFFYDLYNGAVTMNLDTIVDNYAAIVGGGVFSVNGPADIDNSILADNSAANASDLGTDASTFDLRYTLLEDPSGASYNDVAGNIFNQDPQLAPLADNGGPTETHRPALISPVLNAADPALGATPATDQRGEDRTYPTIADMGAVELIGGVIQFNPNTAIVAENAGSVSLTVVRDVGTDEATVEYTTVAGTATAGSDYTTTSGTLTFAPGDLSETILVPIANDGVSEPDEQFTVTLGSPSPDATIGANDTATVTITDVSAGQFVFSSATYSGNESGGSILITVNRINGSDGAASVDYTTVAGSATADVDYTTTTGTLSWADGDMTSKSFSVPILDDSIAEGNETFTVELSDPIGGTLGTPDDATVTIVDDPAGTLQFSVSAINTTEDAGSVTVTVTRTGGTEGSLSANYTTVNGTATAPSDYIPAAGTVTFPAGDATSQTFNIGLVNDAVAEPAESFAVTLSGPAVGSPATLAINLAASDEAALAAVPTLSWWGRMVLMLMSGLAGLYVMMRNRLSMFLVGLLLIGIAAAPPASAAQKTATQKTKKSESISGRKAVKGDKYIGTVESLDASGANLVIKLTDGRIVTVPKAKANILDGRTGRAKPRSATQSLITAGAKVKVKFDQDAQGNLIAVKVKIIG